MSSRRSAATRRTQAQARASAARGPARRRRTFWDTVGFCVLGGGVAMYVALFAAAIVQSAGGAVLASILAVLWALALCVGAHRLGADSRRPRMPRAPRTTWWGSAGWLFALAAIASPTATHWAAGRTRSGRLTFGDAEPGIVAVAQAIGWGAIVVIVLGCPVAWLVGRRSATA